MKKFLLIIALLNYQHGVAQDSHSGYVSINNSGDGAALIKFNTSRGWVFEQTRTDGHTRLNLRNFSVGNKIFQVQTDGGFAGLNQEGNYNYFISTAGGKTYFNVLGGRIGIGTTEPLSKFHVMLDGQYSKAQTNYGGDVFIESQGVNALNAYGGSISFSKASGGTGKRASIVAKQTSSDPDAVGLAFLTHGNTPADDMIENFTISHSGNLSMKNGLLQFNRSYENYANVLTFRSKDNNSYGDYRFETETTDTGVVRTIAFFDGGRQGLAIGSEYIPVGYKLAVDGKAIMEEIKVEVINPPDYVFADDYKLSTLEETASYIQENHHLPEVPSATEMEANGVNLGEMNMLLLKKIEELTLHLIEIEKENKLQSQEILQLKKLIK